MEGKMIECIAFLLQYEDEAFENDEPVSGINLVDFLARWRRVARVLVPEYQRIDTSGVETLLGEIEHERKEPMPLDISGIGRLCRIIQGRQPSTGEDGLDHNFEVGELVVPVDRVCNAQSYRCVRAESYVEGKPIGDYLFCNWYIVNKECLEIAEGGDE